MHERAEGEPIYVDRCDRLEDERDGGRDNGGRMDRSGTRLPGRRAPSGAPRPRYLHPSNLRAASSATFRLDVRATKCSRYGGWRTLANMAHATRLLASDA